MMQQVLAGIMAALSKLIELYASMDMSFSGLTVNALDIALFLLVFNAIWGALTDYGDDD